MTPSSGVWEKPSWLTEASVGARESYDSDVFLSGVNGRFLPASYTVPSGSVAALKNEGSWVTSASFKLSAEFAPLLASTPGLQHLSLTYTPEVNMYHNTPSENYSAQRLGNVVSGKMDSFSYGMDIRLSGLTAMIMVLYTPADC